MASFWRAFLFAAVLPLVFAWFASAPMLYTPWMKHCGTREFCPPAPAQTHMWMNLYSDPLVDLNRSFVNVEFEVEPGFALRGWLLPGTNEPTVGVVMCHGGGVDRRAMIRHIPTFPADEYDVLLFDQSDMGVSDTRNRGLGFGSREHRDILAAVRFLLEQRPQLKRVVLFGTSMGAAASIVAAAQRSSSVAPYLGGIIAENPFAEVERLLLHALDHVIHGGTLDERGARSFGLLSRAVSQYPWLLPEWLKKLAVRFAIWRAGVEGYNALAHVAYVTVPILYIHSTADDFVPVEHSHLLYNRTVNGDLWILDHARHSEIINQEGDRYRQRVRAFVRDMVTKT